ncbi:hypothetical protein HMPREF3203_00862 [Proteus mirabilis]|nr:hypothetical protein HMPREF3203_00862 [Proteus mirabilis]
MDSFSIFQQKIPYGAIFVSLLAISVINYYHLKRSILPCQSDCNHLISTVLPFL